MSEHFLVECYWPGVTEAAYAAAVHRVAAAASPPPAESGGVRFVDSLLVPVDEVAFYRFTGRSTTEVAHTCTRAGLPFQRIMEYVSVTPGGGTA